MSRSILLLLVGIQSILVAQEINHVTANTPKDIQIQVLKSAAPRAVSDNADLYILTNHGYELAVKGTNGFSCLIEREMTSTMEPACYDAEGTKTASCGPNPNRAIGKGRLSVRGIPSAFQAGYRLHAVSVAYGA